MNDNLVYKDMLIDEILSINGVSYDNDILILDLSSLYVCRPSICNVLTLLDIQLSAEEVDIFDSVFMTELVEYFNNNVIDEFTIELMSEVLEYIIDITSERMSINIIADLYLNNELLNYIIKFNYLYRNIMNKFTTNYINDNAVRTLGNLSNVNKFYTVDNVNIILRFNKTYMQAVLNLRTKRI